MKGSMERNMKNFKIGQQWRCRNGNRAVVVAMSYEGAPKVWVDNGNRAFWFTKDGKLYGSLDPALDLIELWAEKRSMEVEVFMYDDGQFVFAKTDAPKYFPPSVKLLARKKITITEGEGM